MNSHRKKMIAPIVVSAVMILYYVVYFARQDFCPFDNKGDCQFRKVLSFLKIF